MRVRQVARYQAHYQEAQENELTTRHTWCKKSAQKNGAKKKRRPDCPDTVIHLLVEPV
jgi:hypothetical protein